MTRPLLTIILALTGMSITVISLNTALGGMFTLGWQFPPNIAEIIDPNMFHRHDSNARFFAGALAGLGVIITISGPLPRFRHAAALALLCVALGGVFRLIHPGYSVLADPALLPSTLIEIILAPALAIWSHRSIQP